MSGIKEQKLKESACDLAKVGAEVVEQGIKMLTDNPVAERIPVLNILSSIGKMAISISDYIYYQKIIAFLEGCHNPADAEVKKYLNGLDDPKTSEKIGQNILMIIDKTDSLNKAELIGRASRLLVDDKISLVMFYRLCHMINNSFLQDLQLVKDFERDDSLIKIADAEQLVYFSNLKSIGLLDEVGKSWGAVSGKDGGVIEYCLTDYGKLLKAIL